MKAVLDGQTPEIVESLRGAAKLNESSVNCIIAQVIHKILNTMMLVYMKTP